MTRTAPASSRPHPAEPAPTHEHGWSVQSRHRTTQGLVLYVRCVACRALRVDVQEQPDVPPSALTGVVHV